MRRFSCSACGNEVHFDNTSCVACGAGLAYDPGGDRMLANAGQAACANADACACNWIAPAAGGLCLSCARTRMIPDLDIAGNDGRWTRLEQAKRHLFRAFLRLGLPFPSKAEDAVSGLAFDFLGESPLGGVTTGHAGGVVTIDIAEADDAERAGRRESLGEPYRTLLGHMRHETGHYYWDMLVERGGRREAVRAVFGDERQDYGAALQRHYAEGPPAGWRQAFVSAYATAHPWEDFAESWAHYLHIVDGLETAREYSLAPTIAPGSGVMAGIEADPYVAASFEDLMADFVPLTVAINALNRSVGQPDFYPFVLSAPAIAKLACIHDLVRSAKGS